MPQEAGSGPVSWLYVRLLCSTSTHTGTPQCINHIGQVTSYRCLLCCGAHLNATRHHCLGTIMSQPPPSSNCTSCMQAGRWQWLISSGSGWPIPQQEGHKPADKHAGAHAYKPPPPKSKPVCCCQPGCCKPQVYGRDSQDTQSLHVAPFSRQLACELVVIQVAAGTHTEDTHDTCDTLSCWEMSTPS